jgi:hypothetical protein
LGSGDNLCLNLDGSFMNIFTLRKFMALSSGLLYLSVYVKLNLILAYHANITNLSIGKEDYNTELHLRYLKCCPFTCTL